MEEKCWNNEYKEHMRGGGEGPRVASLRHSQILSCPLCEENQPSTQHLLQPIRPLYALCPAHIVDHNKPLNPTNLFPFPAIQTQGT